MRRSVHMAGARMAGARAPRRGSIYLMVLAVSAVVTVIGVTGLMMARIELRVVATSKEMSAARAAAVTAVDVGLYTIENDPGQWSQLLADNFGTRFVFVAPQPLAEAAIAVDAFSPTDGSSPRLIGIGTSGGSRHVVEVAVSMVNNAPAVDPGSWRHISD